MIVPLLMCLIASGDGHTKLNNGPGVEPNSAFEGTWKRVSYNSDGKNLDLDFEVWWVMGNEDWYQVGRHGDYLNIIHWTYVTRNKDEFGNSITLSRMEYTRGRARFYENMKGYYKLENGTLTVTTRNSLERQTFKGLEPGPGKIVEVFRRVEKPKAP